MAENIWYPVTTSNSDPLAHNLYNPLSNSQFQFQQFNYNVPLNSQNINYTENQNISYDSNYQKENNEDFDNEPPLLTELGIDLNVIKQNTLSVLNPFKKSMQLSDQNDLAGPLFFCLLFGFCLLMVGKVHFGYIYGISGLGSISMYGLLNLMSQLSVSYICIISVLGYSLLPIIIISALSIFCHLNGLFGTLLIMASVLWCALSASKMFVDALKMHSQQILILYPCVLLYGVFALLAIF